MARKKNEATTAPTKRATKGLRLPQLPAGPALAVQVLADTCGHREAEVLADVMEELVRAPADEHNVRGLRGLPSPLTAAIRAVRDRYNAEREERLSEAEAFGGEAAFAGEALAE